MAHDCSLTIRLSLRRKDELIAEAAQADTKVSALVRRMIGDDGELASSSAQSRHQQASAKPDAREASHTDLAAWRAIRRAVDGKPSRMLAIEGEGEPPAYDSGWASTPLLRASHREGKEWLVLGCSRGLPTAPDFTPATVVATFNTRREAQALQRRRRYTAVVRIEVTGSGQRLQAAMSEEEINRARREAGGAAARAAERSEREKHLVELLTGERKVLLSEFTFVVDPRPRPRRAYADKELHLPWDQSIDLLRRSIEHDSECVGLSVDERIFIDFGKLVVRPNAAIGCFKSAEEGWLRLRELRAEAHHTCVVGENDLSADELDDALAHALIAGTTAKGE